MRKLTNRQFEKAASKTRKEPRTLKMAKEVLVEGAKAVDVAKNYASSKQIVLNAVYYIYDIHLQSLDAPKGWIEVNELFPAKEAKEISKRAKQLLLEYNKTKTKK